MSITHPAGCELKISIVFDGRAVATRLLSGEDAAALAVDTAESPFG